MKEVYENVLKKYIKQVYSGTEFEKVVDNIYSDEEFHHLFEDLTVNEAYNDIANIVNECEKRCSPYYV